MIHVDTSDHNKKDAAELYWLAYLLTGRRDLSLDIVMDAASSDDGSNAFFSGWMRAWGRRLVVSKALAAIREELAESARRTEAARTPRSAGLPANWSLSEEAGKARIEEALLKIDPFPRAALVLSFFEGVRVADLAVLLDAGAALVKKAQAMGVRALTANLAGRREKRTAGCPILRFVQATN